MGTSGEDHDLGSEGHLLRSVALYGREKWKLDSHAGGQAGRVSTGVRNSTGKFANYGCQ